MKARVGQAAIALGLSLAAPAHPQDAPAAPLLGVRGEPTRRGVIDLREPAATRFAPLSPIEAPQAIHPPMPPPPDRAGAVPEALRSRAAAPAAAPEALRSVLPFGPSPPITESFAGLPDNNTRIPPDTHGAVGPNHLMITLNSEVRVSNRAGAIVVADRTLNAFWTPVGGGAGAFDPRVVYDPFANRWLTVACDDARVASSAILLGASRTGDPAGVWDLYNVDADAGDTLWADFPSIGFNSKWVVVQVNMFKVVDDTFERSHIYVFDRAALYAGSAPYTLIQDLNGFTQAPAVTYDMTQNDLFLVEEWNAGVGALRLSRISGAVGSEALFVVGFPIGPSWQFGPPVSDHAPQLGSATRIATNDARIQNHVYRNGSLWTTHTVFDSAPGPDGRALVQWWQLLPSASVVQSGRIDDPSGANFYAFPSIAVNKLGDAMLGFSCYAATRFASACYAFRKSTDAPGTFQDVATFKEGLAKYYKTFSGSVNRWGDYSATAVDPLNDVDLWTIQEYAATPVGPDRWGTWWGHLALPPDITIDDVSLAEGNSGTTNAGFTISLSFAATQLVEVDWVAANGSATLADPDFLAASGRASFAPGVTSQVVNVPVVGDFKLEPDESFVVNLSSPLFGVIADAQGQGTITNDDPVPSLAIDDVRVVEGDAGTANAVFTVTLSNPSAGNASASWSTSNGSAVAPADYAAASGTVNFVAGDTSETLTVLVQGDVGAEPNETFHVDLSAPLGAVVGERRGVGTILDDDGTAQPDVTAFTIVSDGATGATSGHNRLQWVNPVGGNPGELRIRFNKGNGCTPPANPAGPSTGLLSPPLGTPGEVALFDHNGLDLNTSYCYTFWVMHDPGPVASAGASVIGRPFDATGRVKWKYATSTTTTGVAAPTVSLDGVFAVDNSGDLHAMRRTASGGPWPPGPPAWYPTDFGSPSQARNPIVPLGGVSRAFISTQDGRVHSVDTRTGAVNWSRTLSPASVIGAPAGVFTAFGGEHDAVLAGTSAANDNLLHALDPATGAPVASWGFPANPGIGPILGMPVVDYSRSPQNRVYFASQQGSATETLWCLELGPAGPVSFALKWKLNLGNISGGPVQRGDRVYVGTDAGEVLSLDAATGGGARTINLGDGPVRGFVFPDRASGDVYVSTSNKVWRLTDTGAGWTNQWPSGAPVPSPSPPLLRPGATHVYVGGSDGKLYQVAIPGGTVTSLALDFDPPGFVVGAPSYDSTYGLVHVGSVRGVFYAVEVPIP